jgi:hypothetical protein
MWLSRSKSRTSERWAAYGVLDPAVFAPLVATRDLCSEAAAAGKREVLASGRRWHATRKLRQRAHAG